MLRGEKVHHLGVVAALAMALATGCARNDQPRPQADRPSLPSLGAPQPDRLPSHDDVAPEAEDPWSELAQLKAQYGQNLHEAPDDVLIEARRLMAATGGLEPDYLEKQKIEALHQRKDVAEATADQLAAWEEVIWLSMGNGQVSWDSRLKTPARIETWQQFDGPTVEDALKKIEADYLPLVLRLLAFDPSRDAIVRRSTEPSPATAVLPAPSRWTVLELRYDRYHDELPVTGGYLDLTIRPSGFRSSSWMVAVSAGWLRDLPDARKPPRIAAEQAASLATASDPDGQSTVNGEPRLVISTVGHEGRIVYEVSLRDGSGEPWRVTVDATTGEIMRRDSQIRRASPAEAGHSPEGAGRGSPAS